MSCAVGRAGGNRRQVAEDHGVEVLRVERLPIDVSFGSDGGVQLVERLRRPRRRRASPARCRAGPRRRPRRRSSGRSPEIRPSVTNVFFGSKFPVRTSAGPTLSKVSGKSMITSASGLPRRDLLGLGVVARLLGVVDDRLRRSSPPLASQASVNVLAQAGAVGVVTGADVDRLALGSAELLLDESARSGPGTSPAATSGSRRPSSSRPVISVAGRGRRDLQHPLADRDRLGRSGSCPTDAQEPAMQLAPSRRPACARPERRPASARSGRPRARARPCGRRRLPRSPR